MVPGRNTTNRCCAGFTPREDGGPGPAELSGRLRLGDCIVGINGVPLADATTFNDFARAVREASWPLTLHTARDPAADPSDAEGWVARVSVCTVASAAPGIEAAGAAVSEGKSSASAAQAPRRYLIMRGKWLYYHRPVGGGALAEKAEGVWDLNEVRLPLYFPHHIFPHVLQKIRKLMDSTLS